MDFIRATKALLGSVLTTLSCSIALVAAPAGAEDVRRGSLSDRFEQDFRQALDPGLTLYGVSPGVVTRTDRSGLSINIAAGRAKEEGAGVATRFQVSGDFEITISYELRSDKRPEKGFGAGLKIWMSSGVPPRRRAITFAHMRRQKSDNQRVAMVASWDDEGKKSIDSKTFDATASRGKMRMTRAGPTIYFFASDEDGAGTQELYQADVGTDDIETMRIQATSSGAEVPVEVCLTHLTIRADKLSIGQQRRGEPTKWRWIIFGTGMAAICGIAIVFWRRRSR